MKGNAGGVSEGKRRRTPSEEEARISFFLAFTFSFLIFHLLADNNTANC